jgi:hypothetical protein
MMFTRTLAERVPLAPWQVSVYRLAVESAPVDVLCEEAQVASEEQEVLTPGPVSVQLEAWVADHVTVEAFPARTRVGSALIESVMPITVTVALVAVVPEGVVHCTVYWVVSVGVTVTLPLTAPPVERLVPALVVEFTGQLQVHVEEPPGVMLEGLHPRVGGLHSPVPCA